MSYDDEHSVRLKAEFAADMQLGGVMVWSVETDDFKGLCSNATIKYPLLRTLNSALSRKGRGEVPPEEEEVGGGAHVMITVVMPLKQECDPENYASPVSVSTTPYTGRLHLHCALRCTTKKSEVRNTRYFCLYYRNKHI